MAREAREKLDTKLQTVLTDEERAVLTVETAVGMGRPADEIIEYADNHGIDLIVMGTHGRGGVEKMWLGSVTEKVLRKARCPVLVLHGGA
jgi:nucleotide-binding universal stress UspA family protein